jgi:hypothetical protein
MSSKMEERAEALMSELARRGWKPGDTIANAIIVEIALGIGIDGANLDTALEFAGEEGWIENGAPGFTILTLVAPLGVGPNA